MPGTQRAVQKSPVLGGQHWQSARAFLQPVAATRVGQLTPARAWVPAQQVLQSLPLVAVWQSLGPTPVAAASAAAVYAADATAAVPKDKPKKPTNAYSLWLGQNRPALVKEAGTSQVAVIGKLAGQKWNAMSEAQKAPFEEQFAQAKALYQKAIEEYEAAGGQVDKPKSKKTDGPQAPKKPASSYMIWLSENRPAIVLEAGTSQVGVVGKLAGEKWKKMTAKQKAVYDTKAEAAKEEYAKAVAEFEAQGGTVAKTKASKKAADPDKPKPPSTAYMLWINENRPALIAELGSSKPPEVSKFAGARWKKMSDAEKAPYQAKVDARKKEYAVEMEEYKRKKASSAGDD